MEDIYDEVVIELTEEETRIADEYAEYKNVSLEDAFKIALFEKMERDAYLYDE